MDRLAVTRGFAETYVARDDVWEALLFEEAPDIAGHLMAELRAVVEHGEQDTFELEVGFSDARTGPWSP